MMTDGVVISIDMGGTNVRLAAVTSTGDLLSATRASTPADVRPNQLLDLLEEMAVGTHKDLEGRQIVAIAAGMPANVRPDGVLFNLPNVPTLEGMDLRSELQDRFRVPAVVDNDATAAAIGESWVGASRDAANSVMLTLGTGVGGGLIINGEPLRGIDGTAGKLGHIGVEPEGAPCGCGSRGCVEQYASATAMVRLARENGLDAATSAEVYQNFLYGDPRAKKTFSTVGYYLGIVLAGIVNTLNPEVVVIGGGASAAWDAFIGDLRRELSARAFDEPVNRARIVRSELMDNAGIIGGARSAFLELASKP